MKSRDGLEAAMYIKFSSTQTLRKFEYDTLGKTENPNRITRSGHYCQRLVLETS